MVMVLSIDKRLSEVRLAWPLQAGNSAFQQQRHQQAADEYSKAIDMRVDDPAFAAVLYGNRAAAHHALGRYVDAIADCFSAASLDPLYIRVLQRRADAYVAIGDHSNAAQVFTLLCICFAKCRKLGPTFGQHARHAKQSSNLLSCLLHCITVVLQPV